MYIFRRMRVERAFSRFRRRVSSAFSSGVRCLRLPYLPRDLRGRPSSWGARRRMASPKLLALAMASMSICDGV